MITQIQTQTQTQAQPLPIDASRTPWLAIATVVFAGIASALHIGKATIGLPSLQQTFGGTFASLSVLMSAFPFVGVLGGVAAGLLVRRWGDRRLLVSGLVILGAASLAGAAAHDFAWLLGTRFVEGLGFLIVVVASPAVLNRVTPAARRSVVIGLWSTFMASGIATSMLVGPLLDGWREAWRASAALVLLAAVALLITTPADTPAANGSRQAVGAALRAVVASRPTTLLALCFTAYNVQFFAVMTFLPVFLMQRLGVALATAGVLSAAIVAANALGNLAAGALLARGMRAGPLLTTAALAMGCSGAGLFHPATPAPLAVALGFVFSAIAGMLPATVLASAPSSAPAPSLAPLAIGWVMQGNYLGQVLGPLLIGAIVGGAGWSGAIGLLLGAAMVGAGLALALPRGRVVTT